MVDLVIKRTVHHHTMILPCANSQHAKHIISISTHKVPLPRTTFIFFADVRVSMALACTWAAKCSVTSSALNYGMSASHHDFPLALRLNKRSKKLLVLMPLYEKSSRLA